MSSDTAFAAPEAYRAAFERLEGARRDEPTFLRELRTEAWDRFNALGFPNRKQEDWRFTDLSSLAQTSFSAATPGKNGVKDDGLKAIDFPGLHRLVFVNGHLSKDLSQMQSPQNGVSILDLPAALREQPELLEEHWGRHAGFDDQPFVALNTAFASDGAVVHIERGVNAEIPLHIVFVSTNGATVAYPRVLVVADESAEFTVVESHLGNTAGYFACGVTEIATGDNARVDHYKLQKEHLEASHLHTLKVYQQRDSRFASHSISTGGRLVRHDVRALIDGEGADCVLNGLYMVRGEQFVDTHMFVEHAKPNCTSHELYKGILEERSRAVFNGRIFVHREAQKTDAVQSNRNLLLSREALVNSNPQLEIFADDVRCTHGSTTGHLSEDAIFYLRSRGMSEAAARSLLIYAFASDIVERIKVEPVRKDLEEFLFARLPRGETVRQAV